MDKRKEGLTMVQVRVETRDLIKRLALNMKQTIPDFLAHALEQYADAVGETKPEEYKIERKVDRELTRGDFKDRGARKPKKNVVRPITVDNLYVPNTPKEWFELYGDDDISLEFSLAFEKKNGANSWPGVQTYYNNLHIG